MTYPNRSSVVVHGPKACGKTHNAELLRRHFKCEHVMDNFCYGQRVPPFNTLVLAEEPVLRHLPPKVQVVPYADAIKLARAE